MNEHNAKTEEINEEQKNVIPIAISPFYFLQMKTKIENDLQTDDKYEISCFYEEHIPMPKDVGTMQLPKANVQ